MLVIMCIIKKLKIIVSFLVQSNIEEGFLNVLIKTKSFSIYIIKISHLIEKIITLIKIL